MRMSPCFSSCQATSRPFLYRFRTAALEMPRYTAASSGDQLPPSAFRNFSQTAAPLICASAIMDTILGTVCRGSRANRGAASQSELGFDSQAHAGYGRGRGTNPSCDLSLATWLSRHEGKWPKMLDANVWPIYQTLVYGRMSTGQAGLFAKQC